MSAAEPFRSFAATLTPSGRGAVAVIGIRGPLADAVLAKHFQRGTAQSLEVVPLRRILYGTWQSSAEQTGPREDVVLTRLETHWELGCHGGVIAAASILRDLAAAGIETVSWQTWLTATSKNRLQASAAVALAAAQSPAAALALLRAAELTEQALHELLETLSKHALRPSEATLDAMTRAAINGLLDSARWAKHLTSSWHIVLAGLPNAGKSSLLNALVGYERAIVFEQPGTTRDVVTAAAAYEGWRWELRDTAGLRATDDSLEALGIERTNAMLAASDVTVLVIDGTRPWSESEDLRRAHPAAIIVRNKSDLWADASQHLSDALHGEGEAPAEPLADNSEKLVALTPALSRATSSEIAKSVAGEGERPAEPLVARASSPWNHANNLGQDAQGTALLAVSAVTGRGLEDLRAAIHARLDLPAWDLIGACVWDAALEHDLRTLQRVLRDDPAALPVVLLELRTWIE